MARVRLVQKDEASVEVRELFQKIEDNGARIINLYRVAANSPSLLLNLVRLGNSIIARTNVPPELRELIILRVAKLTGCDYEWAQHAALARQAGLSQQQIEGIAEWKGSAEFDAKQRAVLQYVDETQKKVKVSDRTFNSLKNYFSEPVIVEITVTAGYYGMLARLLVPLQVDIDSGVGSAAELTGRRTRTEQ